MSEGKWRAGAEQLQHAASSPAQALQLRASASPAAPQEALRKLHLAAADLEASHAARPPLLDLQMT